MTDIILLALALAILKIAAFASVGALIGYSLACLAERTKGKP